MARAIDDSLNMPVVTALPSQTITVTAPVIPENFSLLSPFETFNGALANDNTAIELGLQFVPTVSGDITELRYYWHEDDANDTDIRKGHIWNASGELIATAEFTSTPNQIGWQIAVLSTPVFIQGGSEYTVLSYRFRRLPG